MERNFRDTTDKIEIEMKEVKEKLSGLTASVENRTQEGQLVERDITEKKLLRATQLLCMATVIAGCRPTQHILVLQ